MTNQDYDNLVSNCQPHAVFNLGWGVFYPIDFAQTFIPKISGIQTKNFSFFDGAQLVKGKNQGNKLHSILDEISAVKPILYSYPHDVFASTVKNRIDAGATHVLVFFEVHKNDFIDVYFKFGSDFTKFLKDQIKIYKLEKNISDLEKNKYSSTVKDIKNNLGGEISHLNLINFIGKTLNLSFLDGSISTPSDAATEFYCEHCSSEFTLELIKTTTGQKSFSKKQTNLVNGLLTYLNLYRKDFGLDTCLRKSHFIAQIAVESDNFQTMAEYEKWRSNVADNLIPGVYSKNEIPINTTIVESLKDHLKTIFSITDKDNKLISKTNDELKEILLAETPNIVDKELYLLHEGDTKKLKQVLNADKTVKFNINLLPHTYFGIPLLSRMYAPYPEDKRGLGNGDELTRDGWKFKGRGLKQVTGRAHYEKFSNYRKDANFTDDKTGYIDFTAEKPGKSLKGNYLKLSDEHMYGTQSALYFWNAGTKVDNKLAKDHANDDKIESVINCINTYDTADGKKKRRENYDRARGESAFNVNRHYKLMLETGTEDQKKVAKTYLEQRKNAGDKQAETILTDYEKSLKDVKNK